MKSKRKLVYGNIVSGFPVECLRIFVNWGSNGKVALMSWKIYVLGYDAIFFKCFDFLDTLNGLLQDCRTKNIIARQYVQRVQYLSNIWLKRKKMKNFLLLNTRFSSAKQLEEKLLRKSNLKYILLLFTASWFLILLTIERIRTRPESITLAKKVSTVPVSNQNLYIRPRGSKNGISSPRIRTGTKQLNRNQLNK